MATLFKSGGTSFFEFAPARLDAIEQVTVSTAGVRADASAEGAMQIRFVTRRGTDTYHGKLHEQLYNEDLNVNTFFAPDPSMESVHQNHDLLPNGAS